MSECLSKRGPGAWLIVAFVAWAVAAATAIAGAPDQRSGSSKAEERVSNRASAPLRAQEGAPAAAAPNQTYVGEAKCLECHDEQRRGYEGSPHHRVSDPRSPAAKQGCESCHGPGSAHIDDPATNPVKNFNRMAPEEVSATCTTCHNRGEHALWNGSQHDARRLACTTCHSVHDYKSESKQLKTVTQFQTCAPCHRDKISKLDRSGHMPLREGKMECTTCHNVHGSTNVRLLRKGDSIAEMCTSCHADKRGPYLWEHPPSRDGCVTCHDPHGSSNERMLVAKPPILCQRCHVATRHPSTIYDAALVGAGSTPSIRVFARSCVSCHAAIHGSNHPSGQRFIR
jgi:DmsE family decaheme c-type cytochrome